MPKAAWTHENHLRVGHIVVRSYGAEGAVGRLRRQIRALNKAHGVPNTGGYHKTMDAA